MKFDMFCDGADGDDNEWHLHEKDVAQMNTTALAYLGDGVYELFVREKLMKENIEHVDVLHKMLLKYVSAKGQCHAMKTIVKDLDEKEQSIVRRGRNRRPISKAKNADVMTYKWATAFEALIGYLYLCGNFERLKFVMKNGMEAIDEQSG